jgi:glycerol-3-phosphate acyltransferase PlsY
MSAAVDADWPTILVAALVGYAVGSVNPAAILARLRGVDVRGSGSGNPGATNVARVMGRGWGVLVGVLDVLKGFVPALAFSRYGLGAAEAAGFAAVVGHITSPFLKGHGGKGVATTLGAVLGTQPLWAVYCFIAFAVGFAIFRRMGIGAVFAAAALIVLGLTADAADAKAFGLLLGALVLARHAGNVAAVWREHRGPADDSATGPPDLG